MSALIYFLRNIFDISVVACPCLQICCKVRTVLDTKFLHSSPLQNCSRNISLRVVFLSPCIITKPTVKITNFKCKTLKIQRLLHRVYAQYLFRAILTIFWFALIWKTSAGGIISLFKTISRYPVKLQSISMLLDGDRKDPNFFFQKSLKWFLCDAHLHSEMWNPGYYYFSHLNAPYKKSWLL